jgi:hypothetical protein
MKNLKPYTNYLNESESQPKMIPFLMQINTSDLGVYTYWVVASYPTFHEFGKDLLEDYGIYLDSKDYEDEILNMRDLAQKLDSNLGRNATREVIFWSDGLEFNSDFSNKKIYSAIEASNPFKTVDKLKMYFKNVESVLDANPTGNHESIGYLARSLENNLGLAQVYDKEELEKIIALTSWDEKQKKAFFTMNKVKGMI